MAPERGLPAFVGMGAKADLFVANKFGRILILHPASDLLGRPDATETVFDAFSQLSLANEFALPRLGAVRLSLGDQAQAAVQIGQFGVVEPVAPKFTEDGQALPPKPAGHPVGRDPCLTPACDLAPLKDGKARRPDLHVWSRTSGKHEGSPSRVTPPVDTRTTASGTPCHSVATRLGQTIPGQFGPASLPSGSRGGKRTWVL